jgi:hypothetical protein
MRSDPSKKTLEAIDWADPRLSGLLRGTEALRIDQRLAGDPRSVRIGLGWRDAIDLHPGLLLWRQGRCLVLRCALELRAADNVRIIGAAAHAQFGFVANVCSDRRHDARDPRPLAWITLAG